MRKILFASFLNILFVFPLLAAPVLEDQLYKNFRPKLSFNQKEKGAHDNLKKANRIIARQNKEILRKGYKTSNGVIVKPEGLGIKTSTRGSIKFSRLHKNAVKSKNYKTVIEVVNESTLDGALALMKRDKRAKVAILNFANATHPGGGYKKGASAQEESLCRQTTLYPALDAMRKRKLYPIKHHELLYTPGVKIFRESNKKSFKFMARPVSVDVITQAALNLNPSMRPNDRRLLKSFAKYTTDKIRQQLRAAKRTGHDSFITGAFGCGAFKNNPHIVSKLYAKVLQEQEFKGKFKYIRFSILDDAKKSKLNPFIRNLKPLMTPPPKRR